MVCEDINVRRDDFSTVIVNDIHGEIKVGEEGVKGGIAVAASNPVGGGVEEGLSR